MRGGLQFNPNKTLVEIIKEGNFGGTYFRDIYSSVNGKWYKNSWKEFYQLKDIDQKYIAQVIKMSLSINVVLNVENW